MENERNLCNEAGCSALCCQNVFFDINEETGEEDIKRWFPDAIRVSYDDLTELRYRGVYYTIWRQGEKNFPLIRIVGKCPNLSEDYNCAIYRDRPPNCVDTILGGKLCTIKREEAGLLPVEAIKLANEKVFSSLK